MKAWRLALAALVLTVPVVSGAHAAQVLLNNFSKFAQNNCPLSSNCSVSLGTVPANRIYEITSVSCYAGQNNTSGAVLYWYFTAYNSVSHAQYGHINLRPTRLGISGSTLTWNATESGLVRAPAGATLAVAFQGAGAGVIANTDCTIGGAAYAIQ